MPWSIIEGGGTCADDEWAVVKDDDGSTAGCHATEAEAQAQLDALYAEEDAAALPERFDAVLTVEGETSMDLRRFEPGALFWREPPLPITNADDTGSDHFGAVVGWIDTIERVGDEILGHGRFDLDSEAGREAARIVGVQLKRWVSIDSEPDAEQIDYEQIDPDCDPMEQYCDVIAVFKRARIAGAAIVAFPAYPRAVIVPAGTPIPAGDEDGRPAVIVAEPDADALVAAAIPARPPAEWFTDPSLPGLTALEVEASGRIYGHAAGFKTCHTGYTGVCLTAPRSSSGYAYFRTGEVECDCEPPQRIAVGQITLVGGHAGPDADARRAVAHYDDTRSAVADVAVGEDRHGIWIAGALRPGVTAEQVRVLRASSLSGDWRQINGRLELVAICAVNAPGFPIPRARVASGQQQSLVAAGVIRRPGPVQFELVASANGTATAGAVDLAGWQARSVLRASPTEALEAELEARRRRALLPTVPELVRR